MKKTVLIILCLVILVSLAACGGKDPLKGTWVGENENYGVVTWEFSGNGKCSFATEFVDPLTGTYEIIDGENVTISMWDADNPYTYSVSGDTLTLTSTDGLAPSITMTKK